MVIKPERVSLWFDYVRYQNHLSQRFSDCFFPSQLKSKDWLLTQMRFYLPDIITGQVIIFGGWYGILAGLFRDNKMCNDIVTVDKDPECVKVVKQVTTKQDKIFPVTCDMVDYEYIARPGLVINTSCEHITQEEYDKWYNNIPINTYYILQSNNFALEEHVRTADSIEEFVEQSKVLPFYSGTLDLGEMKRFMIIGRKNG